MVGFSPHGVAYRLLHGEATEDGRSCVGGHFGGTEMRFHHSQNPHCFCLRGGFTGCVTVLKVTPDQLKIRDYTTALERSTTPER